MNKPDLALNNPESLTYHKAKPNRTNPRTNISIGLLVIC